MLDTGITQADRASRADEARPCVLTKPDTAGFVPAPRRSSALHSTGFTAWTGDPESAGPTQRATFHPVLGRRLPILDPAGKRSLEQALRNWRRRLALVWNVMSTKLLWPEARLSIPCARAVRGVRAGRRTRSRLVITGAQDPSGQRRIRYEMTDVDADWRLLRS